MYLDSICTPMLNLASKLQITKQKPVVATMSMIDIVLNSQVTKQQSCILHRTILDTAIFGATNSAKLNSLITKHKDLPTRTYTAIKQTKLLDLKILLKHFLRHIKFKLIDTLPIIFVYMNAICNLVDMISYIKTIIAISISYFENIIMIMTS